MLQWQEAKMSVPTNVWFQAWTYMCDLGEVLRLCSVAMGEPLLQQLLVRFPACSLTLCHRCSGWHVLWEIESVSARLLLLRYWCGWIALLFQEARRCCKLLLKVEAWIDQLNQITLAIP